MPANRPVNWVPNQEVTSARLNAMQDSKADIDPVTGLLVESQRFPVSDKFKGPFSASSSYAVNDVVTYQGDLYSASSSVTPGAAITYVGRTTAGYPQSGSGQINLPAGTAAGDLAVCSYGTGQYGSGTTASGWTQVTTAANQTKILAKLLSSAEVGAGVVTPATGLTYGAAMDMRVFRNASLPTGTAPIVYAASLTTLTVPDGEVAFVAFGASRNNGTATSAGTITGSVSTSPNGAFYQTHSSNPAVIATAYREPTSGSTILPNSHTTWSGYDISSSPNIAGFQITIPKVAAFNPGSWNKLVTGGVTPPTDPIAATAGLRTLGTGSQQAAAGNHTHSDYYTKTQQDAAVGTGAKVDKTGNGDRIYGTNSSGVQTHYGYTVAASTTTLLMRDANGRAKANDGVDPTDLVTKAQLDAKVGLVSRSTATKTTNQIATDASETGTVTLAKSFRLLKVTTNRPARIRLYASAAQRDADIGRPSTTALENAADHGCLLDFVSAVEGLGRALTPQVDGSNLESTPTTAIPYTITNLDGSSATVTATFTYITTEV